jgi:ribosomal-protein-alanine N-acetyltransferase
MIETAIARISSPLLSTPRLILRPFSLDDASALFSWSSDPEVTAYLRFTVHEDMQESRSIISRWLKAALHPPFFHWAIERRDTQQIVGSIGIEIVSLHDNRGELGYCLAKSAWNCGYATEAVKCIIQFAMDRGGFHRLEACHAEHNQASGRVMEKAGMHREAGPLHHYYRADILGYQNVYMYAITQDEYIGVQ